MSLGATGIDSANQQWWKYVRVLADDNMEGRNTGRPGHRRAAEYVAKEFKSSGERARRPGASDQEIHDTVLIASALWIYNRYVDGPARWAPDDPEVYRQNGARLAGTGYVHSMDGLDAR